MSSKRNVRQRCCTRKAAYDNIAAAQRAVRRIFWTYRERMHAYHCPFCGRFHVGHARNGKRTRNNFKTLT
jgi:hypothetical protein